jgi:hypothetical protein
MSKTLFAQVLLPFEPAPLPPPPVPLERIVLAMVTLSSWDSSFMFWASQRLSRERMRKALTTDRKYLPNPQETALMECRKFHLYGVLRALASARHDLQTQ